MPGLEPRFPRLLPRKTLRVAVGDSVSLNDLRQKSVTAATLDEATGRIMDAITALVAELREATPRAPRYDPEIEETTGERT